MVKAQPDEVAIPHPSCGEAPPDAASGDTFKLSSHTRAREALDLALAIQGQGFNAFVLGEDRCGRMSTTIDYLRSRPELPHLQRLDWLYLANFWVEREPYAFGLAAGEGRRFKEHLERYLRRVWTMMAGALESDIHKERIATLRRKTEMEIAKRRQSLEAAARDAGFDLESSDGTLRLSEKAAGASDIELGQRLQSELSEFEREMGKQKAGAAATKIAMPAPDARMEASIRLSA